MLETHLQYGRICAGWEGQKGWYLLGGHGLGPARQSSDAI